MGSRIESIVAALYPNVWRPGDVGRRIPITVRGDFWCYGVVGLARRWWQQGHFESEAHALAYTETLAAVLFPNPEEA